MRQWSWLKSGVMLGVVVVAAIAAIKPLGVSTQYVIADAIVWGQIDDELISERADPATGKVTYTSRNAYLNASGGDLARHVAQPLNFDLVFVLAMLGGALAGRLLGGSPAADERRVPSTWRARFGGGLARRYLAALAGGFVALLGARLAGGCTSGHMLSGIAQTALSGFLFAGTAFAAAVPTARLLYRKAGE